MSNQTINIKLLITGIIGFIGSVLGIIGYIIPFSQFPNLTGYPGTSFFNQVFDYGGDYYTYSGSMYLLPFILLIGIAIFSILLIIGSIIPKLGIFGETNPLFIALALFLFVPILQPIQYYTCLTMITIVMTDSASNNAYWFLRDSADPAYNTLTAGYYILIVAICLLLITFFLAALFSISTFIRNREEPDIREMESTTSPRSISKTIISILMIIGSVGFILGLALPIYNYVYRTPPAPPGSPRANSFLLPERSYFNGVDWGYKDYLNLDVLVWLILGAFIIVASILAILANFKVINIRGTSATVGLYTSLVLLLPIAEILFAAKFYWFPSSIAIVYVMYIYLPTVKTDALLYADGLVDDKMVITFAGYAYFIGFLVLVLGIIILLGIIVSPRKAKEPSPEY